MSVQAQIAYPVRTAIDQRGEQSMNRDAKTAGMALVNIQTTENWDVWDKFIRINHSKYQQGNTVFPEDIQDILIIPDFGSHNTTESDFDDISDEEDEI